MSIEEIRKKIREPERRKVINRALYHQSRINFHAQTRVSSFEVNQPLTEFLAFVDNILPHDKSKMFKTLFRYPVATNDIAGICFDKLSRIFDGRNPAFNYQFMTSEQRDDWEWYRQEKLHEPEIWATKGWNFFQTEINSVLIVDMPAEQDKSDKYPQPYFYWLPIASVIDYKANPTTGQMKYIIFKQDDHRIAVIDNESYRVFKESGDNIGDLLVENPHDLGYCPARFFWDEPISLREPDIKKSPLTRQLEAMDWFLFYHISKRHLDMYGSYPIYSGYEQSCDFSNQENGDYCDGGFLKNKSGFYKLDAAGLLCRCPKCGESRINGVGSFVEIPIPSQQNDVPDLKNPVQMLSVDRNSLDYNVEEEKRLKNDIITSVVGTNEEITTRDALNEQQILANFESQSTVLNRIKKGFESAQQFVDETICKLRYGNLFISARVNYGTDFYLSTATQLRDRYASAKKAGASEADLDAMQNQIIETEYRNNPTMLQRMLILAELEPYRHSTREEVVTLFDKGIISESDMRIKLNFANYIRRFEREYLNILEFGDKMPFTSKIEFINQKLKDYESESRQDTARG